MSVPVAARRHDKPLAGVVNNFSLARLDKGLSTSLVADVDKFAVLYRECLDDLIVFGRKNFAVDYEVGFGLICGENVNGNRHCQRRYRRRFNKVSTR